MATLSDREKLVAVLAEYRPAVLAVALDRVGSVEASHDIVQDTMEAALRHLDDLRDPQALPAWLRAIAVNCCRQYLRRDREHPVGLVMPVERESESAYRAAARREMLRQALQALKALPENNRLAFLMHHLRGLPYQHIAAFLGVPVTTVEGRIHRAKRDLERACIRWLDAAVADGRDDGDE